MQQASARRQDISAGLIRRRSASNPETCCGGLAGTRSGRQAVKCLGAVLLAAAKAYCLFHRAAEDKPSFKCPGRSWASWTGSLDSRKRRPQQLHDLEAVCGKLTIATRTQRRWLSLAPQRDLARAEVGHRSNAASSDCCTIKADLPLVAFVPLFGTYTHNCHPRRKPFEG